MTRQLNRREKILAAVALSTIVLYAMVQWIFSPLVGGLQQTDLAISQKHVKIAAMLSVVARAGDAASTGDPEKPTQSPSGLTAQFLRDIDAAKGSVEIHRFQPVRTSPGRKAASGHLALEVKIDCRGQLPHLMAFVSQLESRDRLTRVRHLYLTAAGEPDGRLKCQFSVVRMCSL